MSMTIIQIRSDGTIRSLDDLSAFELGAAIKRRASHIVPVNPLKRFVFRAMRILFGEQGRMAEWTRHWKGPWRCSIVGSSRYFIHPSRRVCLAWERRVLNEC